MFLTFDYFLFALPGILLTMWAQGRISRTYAAASKIPASSGVTGAEAAALVMHSAGVDHVAIEPVAGELSDHYDPGSKILRLSEKVYGGRSLAAVGIAAHEAGHAIQDATHYPGLVFRNLIVPVASLGSSVCWLLIIAGALLGWMKLILVGLLAFSLTVVFQLINLPVEFNASRRGRHILESTGLIAPGEDQVVSKVLNAAAWTYVAATLTSVLTLLFYLVQFGVLNRRRTND